MNHGLAVDHKLGDGEGGLVYRGASEVHMKWMSTDHTGELVFKRVGG